MQHLIELKPRVQYSWYFAAWKCVIQKNSNVAKWISHEMTLFRILYTIGIYCLHIYWSIGITIIDRMKKIMITIRNKQQTKRRFPVNAVYVCLFIYIFSLSQINTRYLCLHYHETKAGNKHLDILYNRWQ